VIVDRASLLDLLLEDLENRAGAAEHVAEADRHEARLRAAGEVADDHLRGPLRGAHHAARAHGLVGRDEDERLDAVLVGLRGEMVRAEDVVADALLDVGFELGDVLVGRRVEDDLRLVLAETRGRAGPGRGCRRERRRR